MRLCLILFPGFPLTAFSLIHDLTHATNMLAGQKLITCDCRTANGRPTASGSGVFVTPDQRDWAMPRGADLLICLGSHDVEATLPMGLRRFVTQAGAGGATLAGFGAGAGILARLGLLAGFGATVPPQLDGTDWPGVAACDHPFVLDRGRLTARDGIATLDALATWLAMVQSPELAEQARQSVLLADAKPSPTLPCPDPEIQRMLTLMQANLTQPLPLDQVARTLGLSPKAMRGRCRQVLGDCPAQVYTGLRLDRAKALIEHTSQSIEAVAKATGFASPSAFSRSFGARFGTAPRAFRRKPVSPQRSAA